MPAAAMRPNMASSIKFLRGTAAGLSVGTVGSSADRALDTYITIRDVRSEFAFRSRSVFNMNSSGFFKKTQSFFAAANNIAEAAIRTGNVNHRRVILFAPSKSSAVIQHTDNRRPIRFKNKRPQRGTKHIQKRYKL